MSTCITAVNGRSNHPTIVQHQQKQGSCIQSENLEGMYFLDTSTNKHVSLTGHVMRVTNSPGATPAAPFAPILASRRGASWSSLGPRVLPKDYRIASSRSLRSCPSISSPSPSPPLVSSFLSNCTLASPWPSCCCSDVLRQFLAADAFPRGGEAATARVVLEIDGSAEKANRAQSIQRRDIQEAGAVSVPPWSRMPETEAARPAR